jgi:hypothetical protein
MKRPRKVVLQLPLADALHYYCGAYIEGSKLSREAGQQRAAGAPAAGESAEVASGEEREVAPLKVTKTVRIQWREDKRPSTSRCRSC